MIIAGFSNQYLHSGTPDDQSLWRRNMEPWKTVWKQDRIRKKAVRNGTFGVFGGKKMAERGGFEPPTRFPL